MYVWNGECMYVWMDWLMYVGYPKSIQLSIRVRNDLVPTK